MFFFPMMGFKFYLVPYTACSFVPCGQGFDVCVGTMYVGIDPTWSPIQDELIASYPELFVVIEWVLLFSRQLVGSLRGRGVDF